jgi:hypothetical protein
MSEPLQIPPALYWRWKAAEAQRRAVLADNAMRMAKVEAAFQAVVRQLADTVPGFDPDGHYATDDDTCSVTAVGS